MASSSVITVGPVLWPIERGINAQTSTTVTTALAPIFRSSLSLFKSGLRFRKLIAVSRDPHIKRWQQDDAQNQIGNQSTHDYDCEGSLRIRSNIMRQRCRQKAKGCYQHSHHDGAKP